VRVALVHDWLTGMRGGERVLEELASMFPGADLFTLVHVPGSTSPALDALDVHASFLSRIPGIARHYRLWLPLFPAAVGRLDLSGYELVVSCSHAVAKSVRVPEGARHLCYCLTPMRYVWDQRDAYLGRGAMRLLASPLVAYLRHFDRATSGPDRVHRFVAISQAVRDRIARHYGRSAEVVHPPVATDRIRPDESAASDFYLLVGGFVPYKREDLALEAFRALGRRLVVAGDGPARRRLESRAPANVEFTGRIPDDELALLYARCRALIHPQEEDFGIAAVEAQAAGRPVIAYGRGGAVDSVRPLRQDRGDPESATGIFFDRQEPAALVSAVERFEKHEALFDPRRIRAWAEAFSPEHFRARLSAQIEALGTSTPAGPPVACLRPA
jgi:glycosyltransferase involved in cell wall biosynthesis